MERALQLLILVQEPKVKKEQWPTMTVLVN